jgi:hypothetical protein
LGGEHGGQREFAETVIIESRQQFEEFGDQQHYPGHHDRQTAPPDKV